MKKHNQSNIYETKTNLSSIVAKVEETGEPFTICRRGVPVADIIVYKREKRKKGLPKQLPELIGSAVYHVDPCAPASEDMWPAENQ